MPIQQNAIDAAYRTTEALQTVLESKFHHRRFIGPQQPVIETALSGRDVFVSLPTGKGKSLCYQLCAFIEHIAEKRITLVFSPTISLMTEQVAHLRTLRIRAYMLCSHTSMPEREYIMRECNGDNPPAIVYLTPEFLFKSVTAYELLLLLQKLRRIARFCIDEAHVITQWGKKFRPCYFELCELRINYPWVKIMLLSATATPECRVDIFDVLQVDPNQVDHFDMTYNRPNLTYEVRDKHDDSYDELLDLLQNDFKGKCGIIYCRTIAEAKELTQNLQESNISARHYHAKRLIKNEVQRDWLNDQIQVLVATASYSLGNHKPNVRFVIHYSVPRSMEAYHHEAGRAGRDGKPARCILFYSNSDKEKLQRLLMPTKESSSSESLTAEEAGEDNIEEEPGSFSHRRRTQDQDNAALNYRPRVNDPDYALRCLFSVIQYATNNWTCRRQQILAYFRESFDSSDCGGKCDVCEKFGTEDPPMEDVKELCVKALRFIAAPGRNLLMSQVREGLLGYVDQNLLEKRVNKRQGWGAARGLHPTTLDKILSILEVSGKIAREERATQYQCMGEFKKNYYWVIKCMVDNAHTLAKMEDFDLKISLLASDVKPQKGWERVSKPGKWLARDWTIGGIPQVSQYRPASSLMAAEAANQAGQPSSDASFSSSQAPTSSPSTATTLQGSDSSTDTDGDSTRPDKRQRQVQAAV